MALPISWCPQDGAGKRGRQAWFGVTREPLSCPMARKVFRVSPELMQCPGVEDNLGSGAASTAVADEVGT